MTGKVKWFNNQRGYGFITSEEGKDVFVHYSDIVSGDKYKTLSENSTVAYELETIEKGVKAVKVMTVN